MTAICRNLPVKKKLSPDDGKPQPMIMKKSVGSMQKTWDCYKNKSETGYESQGRKIIYNRF